MTYDISPEEEYSCEGYIQQVSSLYGGTEYNYLLQ